MWAGVETVGLKGQVDWATETAARSFRSLVNITQERMVATGLADRAMTLEDPPIDYSTLGGDIWDKRRVETSGFDRDKASKAIKAMSREEIDGNTIASVEILFEPNQASFDSSEYGDAFRQALEKSQVYAGAILSVEAHSSYLGYLRGVLKKNWPAAKQRRELASLRNISTSRAMAVRDALLSSSREIGLAIDESQITINGRGIEDPVTGFCGDLPCPPKTKTEWEQSRRVVFRVIAMEAEEEVFTPLNDWN